MKSTIFILLIIGSVFFLRINLPSNDIKNHVLQGSDSIVDQTINAFLLSDSIADWQFIDFIVVKFACSDKLKMRLIAKPLSKWEVYEKDIKSCDDFGLNTTTK